MRSVRPISDPENWVCFFTDLLEKISINLRFIRKGEVFYLDNVRQYLRLVLQVV